ncbi:hypothetical protein ACJX0J_019679, partial [Zea mays]
FLDGGVFGQQQLMNNKEQNSEMGENPKKSLAQMYENGNLRSDSEVIDMCSRVIIIALLNLFLENNNHIAFNYCNWTSYITVSQPRKSTFLYSHMLNSDLIFSVDIIRDSATAGFGL